MSFNFTMRAIPTMILLSSVRTIQLTHSLATTEPCLTDGVSLSSGVLKYYNISSTQLSSSIRSLGVKIIFLRSESYRGLATFLKTFWSGYILLSGHMEFPETCAPISGITVTENWNHVNVIYLSSRYGYSSCCLSLQHTCWCSGIRSSFSVNNRFLVSNIVRSLRRPLHTANLVLFRR